MDSSNRKQITQMVILAVLIAGMIFTTMNLMRQLRTSGARPRTPSTPAVEAKNPSSTNLQAVPGSAAVEAPSTKADKAMAGADRFNANQFKVFALSPARSPFVQSEGWYAEELATQIPGYPELKDQNYFDQGSLYLPKLGTILDPERDWDSVILSREVNAPEYSVKGASSDGLVDTSIIMKEGGDQTTKATWTPESGIPLSELTIPGWEKRYPQLLEGGAEKPQGMPSDADLFGGSTDGLSLPGTAKGEADQISCAGVSAKSGRASALLTVNGRTFMAKQGGMVTPRYQVLEIKHDGAVLVDSRDGSSVWVPLAEGSALSLASAPAGDSAPASVSPDSPFAPLTDAFEEGMKSITESTKKAIDDITKSMPQF